MQAQKQDIAFYLRGVSQNEQLALCREYAILYLGLGPEDSPLLFRDSGSLSDEALPGFAQVIQQAEAGSLRAIVCAELGVMYRSVAEMLEAEKYFARFGAALVFAKERLDCSTALGKAFLYSAETLTQLERQTAANNIRDNMRVLARTGRWLGGITPTGYSSTRVPSQTKGEKIYRLERNPAQAKTVETIYRLFREHDSLAKVTQELESSGVTTKNGRAFSRFTVRQILENPVYMIADADACTYFTRLGAEVCSPPEAFDGRRGMMVYNKTIQVQGQPPQPRDVSEWIVAVGEHKGLIESSDWIAVQVQLARNKSKTVRKPKSDHGVLAELLVCGDCGAHMRPKLAPREEGAEHPAFSYLCERKEQSRSGECDMPNLRGIEADAAVAGMLANLEPDEPDLLPPIPERPITPKAMALHNAAMQEKRGLIKENEDGISKLVFSLIKAIDKSAYEEIIKQIDYLHGQNARLQTQLEAMEALSSPHPLDNRYHDALRDLLLNWRDYYTSLSMARRRAALRSLVSAITWDGTDLIVRFAGGAEFAVTPY